MRLVPLESIRDGSYLGKTIYDIDGRILLNSGAIITNNIRKKLRELNILTAYIIDEYSETEIEEVIKPELRLKAVTLLKETFTNVANLNEFSDYASDKTKVLTISDKDYLESIYLLAEELMNAILSNKNVLFSLLDIKSMDFYTYQHSVNVAILSIILGIGLKFDKATLINLGIGALLHDIGKVFIPKEIITKNDPLNFDEYEIMKQHPLKGYYYLKDIDSLNSDSKLAILQHHERIDGLGYPNGLSNLQINKFARIVAIADVYDALTSNRSYKQPMCASDALEYIMSHVGSIFDFDMVKTFSRVIVPFPFGTIVRLSNGDTGIVQGTLPNFPLRPDIKIIKSNSSYKEGEIIKLVNELSLVISYTE